ncbi:MAG TPA: hypothetical protein VMZ06_04600 [Candidatus Bathyarchaeia archaeon]|nr:hypothetical protein [Candidatus Bathyarchaeia archaeon]
MPAQHAVEHVTAEKSGTPPTPAGGRPDGQCMRDARSTITVARERDPTAPPNPVTAVRSLEKDLDPDGE